MNSNSLLVVAFFVFVPFLFSANLYAQDLDPAMNGKEVAELVDRVYEAPSHKFVMKSLGGPSSTSFRKASNNSSSDQSFRVVFTHSTFRYTVDHNWYTEGVQIWWRFKGTTHPDSTIGVVEDMDMDGLVDFGATDEDVFSSEDRSPVEPRGEEFAPHFQEVYSRALRALRANLE